MRNKKARGLRKLVTEYIELGKKQGNVFIYDIGQNDTRQAKNFIKMEVAIGKNPKAHKPEVSQKDLRKIKRKLAFQKAGGQ